MAFSKGNTTSEASAPFKRYIGLAPVNILSVNPNKAELEKLYNITLEEEPQYIGTKEVNGVTSEYARIDFIVNTIPNRSNNIDLKSKVTFFLTNKPFYKKDNSKVRIIDKYGRDAWATISEYQQHKIPMYKNGPALIDMDYRAAFIGEVELIQFIIAYLGIPNINVYSNGGWISAVYPEECEASFKDITKFFKGDFTELREILTFQPKNSVTVLFGVRSNDEGKQFQTVYTNRFYKGGLSSYENIVKNLNQEISNSKSSGSWQNTEFAVEPLKEYIVKATEFNPKEQEDSEELPW